MKDRKTTSEQSALESILNEIGLPIHEGGFEYDSVGLSFTKLPVLAVWHTSELPTPDELKTLKEIAQERISIYYPQYRDGFFVEGATTLTLNKQKGQWTFHRLTWRDRQMWSSKPTSLTELRK